MKRTLLALATAAALAAPVAAPALAASALPADVTVIDKHNDVDKFKGSMGVAKVSHPFDIYKVRAATSTKNLVVTATFDDLTQTNTKTYQREDGWWTMNGMVQAEVYINGVWKYAINRGMEDEWQSGANLRKVVKGPYGYEQSGTDFDCSPENDGLNSGIEQTIDLVHDKWTYKVPLSCLTLKPGDKIRVGIQADLRIDGAKYTYYDATDTKTPVFTRR